MRAKKRLDYTAQSGIIILFNRSLILFLHSPFPEGARCSETATSGVFCVPHMLYVRDRYITNRRFFLKEGVPSEYPRRFDYVAIYVGVGTFPRNIESLPAFIPFIGWSPGCLCHISPMRKLSTRNALNRPIFIFPDEVQIIGMALLTYVEIVSI